MNLQEAGIAVQFSEQARQGNFTVRSFLFRLFQRLALLCRLNRFDWSALRTLGRWPRLDDGASPVVRRAAIVRIGVAAIGAESGQKRTLIQELNCIIKRFGVAYSLTKPWRGRTRRRPKSW